MSGATEAAALFCSAAESATASTVLVPRRHKQTHQRDGDQTENDAAEQGFDHWVALGSRIDHNSSMGNPSS